MKYKKMPGKNLKTIGKLINNQDPTITIITPFYNGEKTLMETANAIFSQTYPYFEWVIINDGSTSPDAPKALKDLSEMDSRVRVLNKENGGPSQARDYGISKANPSTKYIYFIDCDDIIENNMLEMMYWTLETHKEASFVYPSIINFGAYKYYWEPYFTIEEELVNNVLCINTMVKKSDLLEVGCFEIKEKAMYEDWNLWLKLLAKEKTPIRINPPSFWYRTSTTGELSRARNNNTKAISLIKKTAKTVKKDVLAIQYPRMSIDYTDNNIESMILPDYKSEKSKLFILNDTALNENNILAYELIKRINKDCNISVVTTEPYNNQMRQDIQINSDEFFDMSNFLDYKDYPLFIDYLIKSRKIDETIIIDDTFGYALIPTIIENNPKTKISVLLNDYNESIIDYTKIVDSIITSNEKTSQKLNDKDINVTYVKKDITSKNNIKIEKIDNLKKKYNIPTNKKIITWIDNISIDTRPQVFVEIANTMKDNDEVFFLMSGEGQMEKEIKELIEEYDLTKKILIIDEQEDNEEIIKLSDIIIKTSPIDGTTFIGYEAISNGTPVIVNDIENPIKYIPESCGIIVEHIDSKTTTDFINHANIYVEKIKEMLDSYDKYKKSTMNYANNLNKYYDNMKDAIINTKIKNNNRSIYNSIQLYNYKTLSLKEQFRNRYLEYYKEYHHIVPRETVDNSKAAIYKRKMRSFSISNNVENEMHYVFLKAGYLGKAIKGFVEFIKNTAIYLIYIIPSILISLKILLKLVHRSLAKIKNKIIK